MSGTAHVAPTPRSTRAKKKPEDLKFLVRDVLDYDDDSDFNKMLDCNNIMSITDLLAIPENEVEHLEFTDDAGSTVGISRSDRSMIRILQAWRYHLMATMGVRNVDWRDPAVTADAFEEYRIGIYDPNAPIRNSDGSNASLPATPGPATRNNTSAPRVVTPFSAAAEFRKGIEREKAHYTVLKDEKNWDAWRRATFQLSMHTAVRMSLLVPPILPQLPMKLYCFRNRPILCMMFSIPSYRQLWGDTMLPSMSNHAMPKPYGEITRTTCVPALVPILRLKTS